MRPISVGDIVSAVSGTLAWGDEDSQVVQVVTDSREAKEGSLFVPLIGERVDAHRFIPDVLAQGASCVLSSDHDIKGTQGAGIYVEDTLDALQDLAAWYRSLFDIPVIGITGSVGKTTTKEMIATVLATKYNTLKTYKNLNSQIGVPLMMFRIEEDTEMAVIEMGISKPGEMDKLVRIVSPDCAVMTNIGVSHIGNLGSRENICAEKGKIITDFSDDGCIYICGEGDLQELSKACIPYESCKGTCKTYFYGTSDSCQYYADLIRSGVRGTMFTFHYPGSESNRQVVHMPVIGHHYVDNAVVALALALRYDISPTTAAMALEGYKPMDMRGNVYRIDSINVIDDTYNASPDSIKTNLRALFDYPGDGHRCAILGDVLELGKLSRSLHEDIGRFICKEYDKGHKLSFLITVGDHMKVMADYVKSHIDIPVICCDDTDRAYEEARKLVKRRDWVLVKGSRGMKMEHIVERWKKE